jgi:hypothetical protein
VIETERLLLRPLRDVDAFVALHADERVNWFVRDHRPGGGDRGARTVPERRQVFDPVGGEAVDPRDRAVGGSLFLVAQLLVVPVEFRFWRHSTSS